mmetsp:Transcript_96297/g.267510  ORF Transcript_96297/g.267510 Transcript_96297/m.267510 type:complete len:354 (+) Transcript_96297:720-1781(+)
MHHQLADLDVVRWCLSSVHHHDLIVQARAEGSPVSVRVLHLEIPDLLRSQHLVANHHVQVPGEERLLDRVAGVIVDHEKFLHATMLAPPVIVPQEGHLADRVVRAPRGAIVLPGAGAVIALHAHTVDGRVRWHANAYHFAVPVDGAPLDRARVVRDWVRSGPLGKAVWGQDADRADQGELLEERVVRAVQNDLEHLAIAPPRLGVQREVVPTVVPVVVQGRLEHVIEVHLHGRAVEVLAVVELDVLPEGETVLLFFPIFANGPASGQRGHDVSVRAIVHEALVDPVLYEELVRGVGVGLHGSYLPEKARVRARRHFHNLGTSIDDEVVHGVVELLEAMRVAHQALVQDRWHPP